MEGHVTLPVWLAALLFLLAVWAALDRLLIPSVRWFLRRRLNLFVEEIGRRLLRNADRALSGLEVKAEVLRMIGALAAAGARVHIPRKDQDYAVDVGLRMLTLRRSCDTTRTRSGTCYGSPACMRSERVRSCYA